MKRTFTLFILLTALIGSAWAGVLYFPQKTVDFPVYGNQPEEVNGVYHYRQDVWWYFNDDMSGETIALNGWQIGDFLWSVDVTGDIEIANGHFLTYDDASHYELNGPDIYFTGTQGSITLTATQPDFEGRPYTASYTINYHTYTLGESSHLWDFYSERLAIGRAKDGNSELNNNILWEKSWMGYANQSPEIYKWKFCDIDRNSEQNFRNNFNRDGHIISEANGLQFLAASGNIGIYNENDTTTAVSNRFLAIKEGSSVIIPSSYFNKYTNPRVRIKMAKYGDNITLTVNNAYDALGTEITSDYMIGGSAFWGGKGDWHYRGEYHFQIKDKNTEFEIKVKQGSWLMLYLIEVYDQKEIKSENSVLGTGYQFLNTNTTTSAASNKFYLHFRGKGERSRIAANSITTTGTVTNSINDFTNVNGGVDHTYTSHKGEFGTFRMRLDSYTLGSAPNYCTDYAYRTQSVGYMEPKSYPYTWDFTDIDTYKEGTNKMDLEPTKGYKQQESDDHFHGKTYIPRNVWESDGSFRLANDGAVNVLFCGGSQLWYGKTIIPETAGLAFTPVNYDGAYNGAMSLTSEGLKFEQDIRSWWLWRITVPSVPGNGVIYVHGKKIKDDEYYNVGYYNGGEPVTNKTVKSLFSSGEPTNAEEAREIADGDDVIYVIPASGVDGRDVTLFFTGVIIHKIAVSVDPKSLDSNGWATESRGRVIDPALTAYMTGSDIKTLFVTKVNYNETLGKGGTIELKEANLSEGSKGQVLCALQDGEFGACLLHNTAGTPVEILNGGFHLFVPDMHDYSGTADDIKSVTVAADNVSLLKAQVTEGDIPATCTIAGVNYTNYILSNKYYAHDDQNQQNENNYDTFYRVSSRGAHSYGNNAYLPLETAKVKPSNGTSSNFFGIVYDDIDYSDGINEVDATVAATESVYSINGQKLNSIPTTSGVYIVSGKKVVIK